MLKKDSGFRGKAGPGKDVVGLFLKVTSVRGTLEAAGLHSRAAVKAGDGPGALRLTASRSS
jgi:hypothetical protein